MSRPTHYEQIHLVAESAPGEYVGTLLTPMDLDSAMTLAKGCKRATVLRLVPVAEFAGGECQLDVSDGQITFDYGAIHDGIHGDVDVEFLDLWNAMADEEDAEGSASVPRASSEDVSA